MFEKIKNKISYFGATIAIKVSAAKSLNIGIVAVILITAMIVLAIL